MSLCRGGGWVIALQKNLLVTRMAKQASPVVIFTCYHFKMLPNRFLTSMSTLLDVFSQLATCQLAPGPFEEHAPVHSWAPDRPQKQATGKADRRGVDSEIAINC